MEKTVQHNSYWQITKQKFLSNRLAKWSLWVFFALLFVAIFADFLANEKPIICKLEGQWQTPVFKQYAIQFGLANTTGDFRTRDWHTQEYEFKILPPIPYSATYQDRKNRKLVSPFGLQRTKSWRYRHWLGTDRLGRDIVAGMIAGTRTAMLVGLISMFIAAFFGILLGGVAGFFGDEGVRITWTALVGGLLGAVLGVFWSFTARSYTLQNSEFFVQNLLISLGILLLTIALFVSVGWLIGRLPFLGRKLTLPVDLIVMRLIETFNSIPALLLILAFVATVKKPSILYIMVIIGLVAWTGIAKFIRAELLKIRQLEYIEAGKALGFSDWRILFRHAIPNALTPVLTIVAFGIAAAILIEAALSFLGIGVDPNAVTWGSLLQNARNDFDAWWLAIFPGIAIFVTVTVFNLIGEGLSRAIS